MRIALFLSVGLASIAYASPLSTCTYSGSTSPSQITGSLSCTGPASSISGSFSGNYSGQVASGFTAAPGFTGVLFPLTGNINGVSIEGAQPFVSPGNPSFFSLGTNFIVGSAGSFTANYVLTLNVVGYAPGSNGSGLPLVNVPQTFTATGPITVTDAGAGIRNVTFGNSLSFTAVPEPATNVLLAAGSGLLVLLRKRGTATGN